MSDVTKVDEALMHAIHDAFNSQDVDRIAEFFAEDGIFATARGPHPYGERYVGKAAIKEFLAKRFKSIPEMRWEHLYRYVAGDRAVSYWIVKGKSSTGEDLESSRLRPLHFRSKRENFLQGHVLEIHPVNVMA